MAEKSGINWVVDGVATPIEAFGLTVVDGNTLRLGPPAEPLAGDAPWVDVVIGKAPAPALPSPAPDATRSAVLKPIRRDDER